MTLTALETILELQTTIARVRRAMPRNADVMTLCEALEERIRHQSNPRPWRKPDGTWDRNAYMRDLMRKIRAADKARRAEGKAR
jgi:hypothetical protein